MKTGKDPKKLKEKAETPNKSRNELTDDALQQTDGKSIPHGKDEGPSVEHPFFHPDMEGFCPRL